MSKRETRVETHGCILCGKLYQLYVLYEVDGKFYDFKVMSPEAKPVRRDDRPLVACRSHDDEQVEAAALKVYGPQKEE